MNNNIQISKNKVGKNILDAISNGAAEGVKLAVNVAGMLLVFVAFIAFANYLFTKFGSLTGVNEWIAQVTDGRSKELNLQFILGYAISPLMWLIGIAPQDMIHAGSLLGQKIIMTEFIGYVDLANLKAAELLLRQSRSLCVPTSFVDSQTLLRSVSKSAESVV